MDNVLNMVKAVKVRVNFSFDGCTRKRHDKSTTPKSVIGKRKEQTQIRERGWQR